MSELTRCNYCNLQALKRQAKAEGKRVVRRPSKFLNGIDVWLVPKGEQLPPPKDMIDPCNAYPNGNLAYAKYHVAWFYSLSDRCCC